jgi:hypothetical protein
VRACAGLALLAIFLITPAAAQSCRGYAAASVAALKPRIEALRLLEREAADRIKGLDTRSYEWLVEQARLAAEAIADAKALQIEDSLSRCRNFIPPVRRACAAAATGLVSVIEEQIAGGASKAARQAYADAAANCERLVRLMPLNTALRTTE